MDSTIKEDIEKANMDIQSLNLLTEGSVPDDADCLFIDSPSTDISEDEKTAIIDYLENGGKAMIFSDYTTEDLPNFDAVLENYGVQREAGIVFEGDNQHYAMQMPYYLVPTINSTDASSETVSGGYYVLVPYAQGIKKMDDVRDTVTINSILTTSDQAYSKTDLNSDTLEKEDGDEAGPFDLGVSITETLDDDKETQIVYYSTSNLMESQVNQMKSIQNNYSCSRPYSECWIRFGQNYAITVRIEASQRKYLAFQTQGEIRAALDKQYASNGHDMKLAIEQYIKNLKL